MLLVLVSRAVGLDLSRLVGCDLSRMVGVELEPAGVGRLVDPVSAKSLCKYIGGCLVVVGDDVGVVGFPSSGHGRVDTAAVGGGVYEEKAYVDGAALAGVAGLGITEFDFLGYVVGGEPDGAGPAGDCDAAVSVDVGDGPVVPVLTISPRSVWSRRSLRRVTTSSPTRSDTSPSRRRGAFRFRSPV